MSPEAELLQALRSGSTEITRHSAWLDLFLQLAQPRIEGLRTDLQAWLSQPDAALPFSALATADELAGLCAEQPASSLGELCGALSRVLRAASAGQTGTEVRQAVGMAVDELWRQLHQHAAGVHVVTPPHIQSALQAHAPSNAG